MQKICLGAQGHRAPWGGPWGGPMGTQGHGAPWRAQGHGPQGPGAQGPGPQGPGAQGGPGGPFFKGKIKPFSRISQKIRNF